MSPTLRRRYFPGVGPITTNCDHYFSNVALLLHFDGADTSTIITDSSSTPKTAVAYGTAQLDADQSKFGGSSLLLSGGSNVDVSYDPAFNFGTNDLTVECWIRPAAVTSTQKIMGNRTASTTGWDIYLNPSGGAYVQGSPGASYIQTAASKVTAGAWNHIAWVRVGSTDTLYVNGVAEATGTLTINDSTDPLRIGQANHGLPYPFVGHIDEVRITRGVARYTANFTPPTAPFYDIACAAGDPFFSYVKFLVMMDGAAGTSTFPDVSSVATTLSSNNGSVVHSSTKSKFGGTSAYFNGTNQYLVYAANAAHTLGTSNFTIEYWVYSDTTFNQVFSSQGTYAYGTFTNVVRSDGSVVFAASSAPNSSGFTFAIDTGVGVRVVNTGEWTHIAVQRNGSVFRVFVNGVERKQATATLSIGYSTLPLVIGAGKSNGEFYYAGYIDGVRLTIGVARYPTTGFTPPTSEFPTS